MSYLKATLFVMLLILFYLAVIEHDGPKGLGISFRLEVEQLSIRKQDEVSSVIRSKVNGSVIDSLPISTYFFQFLTLPPHLVRNPDLTSTACPEPLPSCTLLLILGHFLLAGEESVSVADDVVFKTRPHLCPLFCVSLALPLF